MTATTLYSASIPHARRALENLGAVLAKGAAHFAGQGMAEADWLGAALAPDMFPLARQVEAACNGASGLAARLARAEPPASPDTDTSVAGCQARIARTIAYLDSVPASAIDGREDEEIILALPTVSIRFTGASYVRDFALPNLFFHAATAYGILRHKGAPLGKADFLGALDMVPNG